MSTAARKCLPCVSVTRRRRRRKRKEKRKREERRKERRKRRKKKKGKFVAWQDAQWVKALPGKPNGVSLIIRTYIYVRGENQLPRVVF